MSENEENKENALTTNETSELTTQEVLEYQIPLHVRNSLYEVIGNGLPLELACKKAKLPYEFVERILDIGEKMFHRNFIAEVKGQEKPFDDNDTKILLFHEMNEAQSGFQLEIQDLKRQATTVAISRGDAKAIESLAGENIKVAQIGASGKGVGVPQNATQINVEKVIFGNVDDTFKLQENPRVIEPDE